MKTLSQILVDANAVLDLDATLPTGTELTTRANYAGQAIWDAAAKYQLSEFKREYLTSASSLATIPLPSNFREMQGDPQLYLSSGWQEWPVIELEEKYEKGLTERYCYVMGDPASGYNLIFNAIEPADQLSIVYQRYPSGLATLTDKCELADPQYVVRKIESYVLYSRSDDRFQEAERRSEIALAGITGRDMKDSSGQGRDTKSKFTNPLDY